MAISSPGALSNDRGKPRQGRCQGSGCKACLAAQEIYAYKKAKYEEAWKPEGEDKPTLDIRRIDRRAKPNQYGRGFCYFRSRLARSFAHKASLDCGGIGRWRIQAAHVASSANNLPVLVFPNADDQGQYQASALFAAAILPFS
jgi:hypothetical protein